MKIGPKNITRIRKARKHLLKAQVLLGEVYWNGTRHLQDDMEYYVAEIARINHDLKDDLDDNQ